MITSAESEKLFKAKGLKDLNFEVSITNIRANVFYERLGFKKMGIAALPKEKILISMGS